MVNITHSVELGDAPWVFTHAGGTATAHPLDGTFTVSLASGPATVSVGNFVFSFTVPSFDCQLEPLLAIGYWRASGNLLPGETLAGMAAFASLFDGASSPAVVTVTTTGSTFAPKLALRSGSTGTVNWSWSGGSTTGLNPTISFGSSGTRTVAMTVTNGSTDLIADVETFNLGFDHTLDAGLYNLGSGFDYASQSISGVGNIAAMTGLKNFLAQNTALAGSVDLTGMSALQYFEIFNAQVTGVTLTGCTGLIRLDVEANKLSSLDLNPVAGNLYDLRAAYQNGGTGGLTFTPLSGATTMANLYHYCVRDQPVTNEFGLSVLPVVQQLWNWNTGQSGTLAVGGNTHITELRSYSNSYSAVTGLSGANALAYVDLSGSSLNQAAVDGVLSALAGNSTSNGTLNLSNTSAPSSAGAASKATLVGRGWTVTTDASAGGGPVSVVQSHYAQPGNTTINFSGNTTAGNTVIVIVGNALGSTSTACPAPTFNGSPVTGAFAVFNSGTSNGVYSGDGADHAFASMWVLPNVVAGNGVGINLTSPGGYDPGAVIIEVSGLGSSPVVDKSVSAHGASGTPASGTTAATTVNDEIIFGFSQTPTAPTTLGSPWTVIHSDQYFSVGYQTQTSSGATYSLTQTGGGTDSWVAAVVALHG